MKQNVLFSSLAVLLSQSISTFANGDIILIDDMFNNTGFASGYGISNDGSIIVGSTTSGSSVNGEAFLWTQSGGTVGLGDLAGGDFNSHAFGISGDGNVVVGRGNTATANEAFRWTSAGGMVSLGDLGGPVIFGNLSVANSANIDGSVVVGVSSSVNGWEAFRWTAGGGMVGLGDLPTGDYSSQALAVSDNGDVIVGVAHVAKGGFSDTSEAFRWTSGGGMVGLGDLTGGSYFSYAKDVSADGSIVVGVSSSTNGTEAFRWTAASGMVGLGDLAGGSFYSNAEAINSSGTVIVGYGISNNGREAFIWSQDKGMLSLTEWLQGSGISLKDWTLTSATGVSDDGKTIVGYGRTTSGYQQPFIAREKDGMIGLDDTINSLQHMDTAPNLGLLTATTILNGSHGHPIHLRKLNSDTSVWLNGDIVEDDRYKTEDTVEISELGMSVQSGQFKNTLSVGKIWADSTLEYNGKIKSNGYFFTLETDIKPWEDTPLYLTLSYLRSDADLNVRRAYINAGNVDSSNGVTNQNLYAFKAKLQYGKNYLFPYIGYEYVKAKTDSFSESGGGFPAEFENMMDIREIIRIGTDGDLPLSKRLSLTASVEYSSTLNDKQGDIKGSIMDTFSFTIPGRKYENNWFKGMLGMDYTGDGYAAGININRTTKGEDPTMWIGMHLTILL